LAFQICALRGRRPNAAGLFQEFIASDVAFFCHNKLWERGKQVSHN
jgi:hypothetical protein